MTNTPHGGILKVCRPVDRSPNISRNALVAQDLVARDALISHRLKEEAAALPDIVLTDVSRLEKS
jgi:hypothetical protein